ncbi:MAG: hypothetical protein QW660_07715 [Candidatus Bathyarchaeia archaeon]
MIWEVLLFIIACVTSLITLTRTRKVKVPQELLELEDEIQRWFVSRRIKLRRTILAEIRRGRSLLEIIPPERIETYSPEIAPAVWIVGPREQVEEVKAVLRAFRYRTPLLPVYFKGYGEEYE